MATPNLCIIQVTATGIADLITNDVVNCDPQVTGGASGSSNYRRVECLLPATCSGAMVIAGHARVQQMLAGRIFCPRPQNAALQTACVTWRKAAPGVVPPVRQTGSWPQRQSATRGTPRLVIRRSPALEMRARVRRIILAPVARLPPAVPAVTLERTEALRSADLLM